MSEKEADPAGVGKRPPARRLAGVVGLVLGLLFILYGHIALALANWDLSRDSASVTGVGMDTWIQTIIIYAIVLTVGLLPAALVGIGFGDSKRSKQIRTAVAWAVFCGLAIMWAASQY